MKGKLKKPEKESADAEEAQEKKSSRENATNEERVEALDWYYANGKNQTATAAHFSKKWKREIKQPLISSWLRKEAMWRERLAESALVGDKSAKRLRQTQHPEITDAMDLWVASAMSKGILLTGEVLRQKWRQFADHAGIPVEDQLELSNGWLGRFKKRHGLQEFRRHGEAASAKAETVEAERLRIQNIIKEGGYQP